MSSKRITVVVLSLLLFCFVPAFAADDLPRVLLRKKDFAELDAALARLQTQFENGALSEYELRDTYRSFYTLDEESDRNLADWARQFPSSYAAHLALGIRLKRQGSDARGENFISKTPKENIEQMVRFFAKAKVELEKSMQMTKKPYLSAWHLMDVASMQGNGVEAVRLLLMANKMLPDNRLARNRYMNFLRPRWGGSNQTMEQFIEANRRDGVDQVGIMQLEAIMQDDLGLSREEAGDLPLAREHYMKALELAKKIGGTFLQEWLPTVWFHCGKPDFAPYCK